MSHSSSPHWLIPTASVSGLLLIILYALGAMGGGTKVHAGTTEINAPAIPKDAKTYTVHSQSTANTQAWQGIIRSRELVRVAPKLSARITDLTVRAGDNVHKGQVIARLDNRDLQAAYQSALAGQSAAQAQANQADTEARRIGDLYRKQAETQQNYDAAQARAKTAHALLQQAQSAVQASQVMLSENVLVSPLDGIVAERLQEVGDMASPSQAMVTLYQPNNLRLEAPITSSCVNQVKRGMSVNVNLDNAGQKLIGKIDEIVPEIDPQTRTQTIKISLPANKGLQQGQFAWLELACQAQENALLIPVSAILQYGQLQAVSVVKDGKLQTRHIRTGKENNQQIEVLSGLHEGDTILINNGL